MAGIKTGKSTAPKIPATNSQIEKKIIPKKGRRNTPTVEMIKKATNPLTLIDATCIDIPKCGPKTNKPRTVNSMIIMTISRLLIGSFL